MLSRFSSVFKATARAARMTQTRAMSSTAAVFVDKNTRVICQGFTGKQVCISFVLILPLLRFSFGFILLCLEVLWLYFSLLFLFYFFFSFLF